MSLEVLSLLNLTAQLAATLYMVGLIWFVQRVHYPLLAGVGANEFTAYENEHVARTATVVGPPMLAEAGSALLLVMLPPPNVPTSSCWIGLALLAVVWISTALLQVPRHRELATGFDASAHRRLVTTNWIRTVAWSLRGLLVSWMVFRLGMTAAS